MSGPKAIVVPYVNPSRQSSVLSEKIIRKKQGKIGTDKKNKGMKLLNHTATSAVLIRTLRRQCQIENLLDILVFFCACLQILHVV